jgi:hypothetical protein
MRGTKAHDDHRGSGSPRAPWDNSPRAETRTLRAARLLLAFGLRDEWPKIPGLQQVYGSAAHVCPDCDGYETRGTKVVVLASGRKAAGMALNLTTWTRDIVICTNGRDPDLDADQCERLDALNIPVLSARVERVVPQGDWIYSWSSRAACTWTATTSSSAYRSALPMTWAPSSHASATRTARSLWMSTTTHRSGTYGPPAMSPRDRSSPVVASAEGAVAALSIHKSLVPNARKLSSSDDATSAASGTAPSSYG